MIRWGRRALAGLVTVVTATIVGSCIDFGAPATGVASISTLILPSPSVIIGDVLRDSLGAAAPLVITAFDGSGNPLPTEHISYFAIDSTIQVDSNGLVHGILRDTAGARLAAAAGGLQTQPVRIPVSVMPTTATPGPSTELDFSSTADSTSATNGESLVLTLKGSGGIGAQGFIVNFQITRAPRAIRAGEVTAYIGDDAAKPSFRDTTDFAGQASRHVIIRPLLLDTTANSLLTSAIIDTITVHATAKYQGTDLPGTPVDFIVPVKKKP
jgi:hypothetical protein